MGRMVEQIAKARGHVIVAKIDSQTPDCAAQLAPADVGIDFTRPEAALPNIRLAAACGINLVVGTTGWYDQLDTAQHLAEQAGIGVLYAPNFSIGVALFQQLVSQAALLIGPFEEYDVSGLEIHHSKKADSPSGTALSLAEAVLKAHPRKQCAVFGNPEGLLAADEFHFASQRTGSVPGTHAITFDSEDDSIVLTHTARSRKGFAAGAVKAAEWLNGKKGFYTFDDMLFNTRGS